MGIDGGRSRRAARLLAVVTVLAPTSARASGLDLRWRAPAECPDAAALRDAVTRSAGGAADEVDLQAEAVVERTDRWRVTLRTQRDGVAGERRLEAASCSALADATAVVLALALVAPTRPSEPTPPPTAPAAPRAPETARGAHGPETRDASSRGGRHRFAAGVAATLNAAAFPSPAVGAAFTLAFDPGRLRVEASVAAFGGQTKTTGSLDAAGARCSLVTSGARACWSLGEGRVAIGPCAGGDVYFVSADGFGATDNYSQTARWMGLAAGGLVRLGLLSWLVARVGADAVVPLTRPRFIVDGEGALFRPAALDARAALGVEALFL